MIHLLARCGIGDIVSHLSRLESIKQQNNDKDVRFWIGGYKNIPQLCKQILDNHGTQCDIVVGWENISQNDLIKKHFVEKFPNDKVIDLNFELDIFSNKIPDFFKYEMQFPFKYKGEEFQDNFLDDQAIIGIHANTKIGAPDFDHGGKRFWPEEKWIELINKFTRMGYKVVILGSENDKLEKLKETGEIKSFCGKLNVNQTIWLINKCSRFIGTNSWMWEVAAFNEIPTVCLYFTNTFFASLHIPYKESSISENLYIETDSNITTDKIIQASEKCKFVARYTLTNLANANEDYEFGFINNIRRYIQLNPDIQIFRIPRITIIDDLDQDFVMKNQLSINPMFKWVNYPDYQNAITRLDINNNKVYDIIGFNIIRHITKQQYLDEHTRK